jgi:uncharacterized protein YbdZ (MbtH family)
LLKISRAANCRLSAAAQVAAFATYALCAVSASRESSTDHVVRHYTDMSPEASITNAS